MSRASGALQRCAIALATVVLASTPLTTSLGAQAAPTPASGAAKALRSGFAVAWLARINSVLDAAVAQDQSAGAVALVLRDDPVVYDVPSAGAIARHRDA